MSAGDTRRTGRPKLTPVEVVAIRHRIEQGEPLRLLAECFEVTPGAISHIRTGRNWRGVPVGPQG